MATVQAFTRDIKTFAAKLDEQAKKLLVDAAKAEERRVVGEALRLSGVAPAVQRWVDGKLVAENGPFGLGLAGVRPGSKVALKYAYTKEVAKYARELLIKVAPKVSRRYVKGILLFVNGERVNSLHGEIPFNAEITIVPTADYARRLEVGKKRDGQPFIVQAPYNMVELLTKSQVGPKFRKLASVDFKYTDLDNPYILQGRMVGSKYKNSKGRITTRKAWADRSAGEPIRYPTIVINRVV